MKTETISCQLLANQLEVMELALKQLKIISRNFVGLSSYSLNLMKLEDGIVDVEKQIEALDNKLQNTCEENQKCGI